MEKEVYGTLMVKYECPKTGKINVVEPSFLLSYGEEGECIVGYFDCPDCGKEHSYTIL